MPTDPSKTPEQIQLLQQQNDLYRKQLELQAEGYSLSSSYLESLKEILGIRSRTSVSDGNILDINKKINREIAAQKGVYEKSSDVQKQIVKNKDLIHKASVQELSLSSQLNEDDKKRLKYANSNISTINKKLDLLDKEKAKSDVLQDKDLIKRLQIEIAQKERGLDLHTKAMSQAARTVLYTEKQREELEKQNVLREKEADRLKDIEQKIGLTKAVLEGLNKIPFLNGVIDANKALDAAKEKIEAGGSRFQAMSAAVNTVGKQITSHLTDPLFIVGFLVTELIATFKSVDSAIGDLAKGFDMSYNSAANLRMELTDIANFSMDVAVTTKGLQESMMAVGQTLGSNARLNKEDLVTFTKLREQAGYTNEELVGIQKLTLATGGNLEDNAKSFLGTVAVMNAQNKLTINAKQLLKEVANVSDSIKLSIGGTTEKLAEAAFKAKQFGINLAQADQISSSLLDFESSINNEISAELITGKDLNLEKARLLALNGDIAGAGAEILKQVGGTAEFTKMNRIQQEALAKAVGLSRDDLAKSLVDREALAKLGAKEGQSAQDAYNAAVAKYGVEKAKNMLGDEALANQFQQQSVQERFANSIEKLKELFVSLLEPLMPVFDVFADIMGVVGPIVGVLGTMIKYALDFGKYLLIPYGIMKGMQIVTKGMATLNTFLISQNATKLAQIQAQAAVEGTKLSLGQRILITLGLQDAVLAFQMAKQQGMTTFAAIREGLEQTILGKLIMQGWNLGKNLVKYIALTLQAGFRMVMENTIVGALLRQGYGMIKNIVLGAIRLAQSIGTAVAAFAAVTAETFGIGVLPLLALAAVAGAAIYGITKMGDGNFPAEGQGPDRTITSKGTMYEPHPTDNIYVTPQKMVAVGNTSFNGNGGATNTSPNQSPQQQQQSPSTTNVIVQNNPVMLKNTFDNYEKQRVKIA